MYIGSLEAAQPNDAGDDGVAAGRVGSEDFAGPAAIMKNRADWSMVADFLRDLKRAKRGGQAAPAIPEAVFGSGNRIDRDQVAAIEHC